MAEKWPKKDPSDALDYRRDWTAELDGDPIASVTHSLSPDDNDLTIDSESFTDTHTTVWLSGGVAGTTYTIGILVTTDGNRTYERSVTLVCQQR